MTMNLQHILLIFVAAAGVASQIPEQFSWADYNGTSYISEVGNQNFPYACNSGWAFATIDMLNSRIKRMRSAQSPDITLSTQVLLSCDTFDYGCMGGEPSSAIRWISKNNITDETCHSYVAKGYTNGEECSSKAKCQSCFDGSCKGVINSKIYGILDYGTVGKEELMMQEIREYGPIACGINSAPLLSYTSGILSSSQAKRINHFVLVYGWGVENGKKFWRVKNSWGPAWGQKGHFRIVKGENALGIQQQCSWASPIDTWTYDIRNKTLPSSNSAKISSSSSPITYKLPQYLTPSRSALTPNQCLVSWAFSTIQMIADRQSILSKGKQPITLSAQALLNCGVAKCAKGTTPADALIFIQKFGLPEEGCQTYKGADPQKESCSAVNNCAFCNGTIFNSKCYEWKNYKRWKILNFGSFSGAQSMKNHLADGPIVCGMHASLQFYLYQGGIFSQLTIAPKIDHYVEIVGWGSEGGKDYWIGRNSWGTAWGESSFFRIQMNGNNLGIETKCYYSKGLS